MRLCYHMLPLNPDVNDHVPICITCSHMFPYFHCHWGVPFSDPGCLRLHRGAWRLHHRKCPDLCGAEVQEGRQPPVVRATGRRINLCFGVRSHEINGFNMFQCKQLLFWPVLFNMAVQRQMSSNVHGVFMEWRWCWNTDGIQRTQRGAPSKSQFWLVTNFIQCLLSNHHWQSSCFGKSWKLVGGLGTCFIFPFSWE